MGRVRSSLGRSPIGLRQRRRRYETDLLPDASAAPDPDVAQEVIERGICVIGNYLDTSQIKAIRDEVLPMLEDAAAGGNGVVHIDPAQLESLALSELAHGGFLSGTMDAVAGTETTLFSVIAQVRRPGVAIPDIDLWHTDTWRIRLKAMLFLEEVGPGNGPMRYAAESHHRSIGHLERSAYDAVRELRQRSGRNLAELSSRRSAEQVVCTGPAGTLLVFDTRGFHTATLPVDGSRLTMSFQFVRPSEIKD